MIPPRDPDGWKRNFNSFLLIGQSILLFVSLLLGVATAVTVYRNLQEADKDQFEAISRLETGVDLNQTTIGSLQQAVVTTAESIRDINGWREAAAREAERRHASLEAGTAAATARVQLNDDRLDKLEAETTRLSDRQAATDAKLNESLQLQREMQATIGTLTVSIEIIRTWVEEQKQSRRAPR